MCRETSLDDVLQISNVFTNVSKGEVAKSGDLQKAFGTTDISEIVKEVGRSASRPFARLNQIQILKKGEMQVGEKEREHDLSSMRKEIATMVSEKCVDPATQTPYPIGIIEKAMAEAGFSVKPNKTAKSQVGNSQISRQRLEFQFLSRYRSVSGCCKQIPNCLFRKLGCASKSSCLQKILIGYERNYSKVLKKWKVTRKGKMNGKV